MTEKAALTREKNRSTHRKTCPSATWSTTNPSCTGMELNLGLCNDSLSTNCLSHGTAHLYHLQHTQSQLDAHTTNSHTTIVLWTVQCLDYILHTQHWESSVLCGCKYTDRYQWTRVSPRKFWISRLHVHHQTTVKHAKFIEPLSQPVILSTDFVENHNQMSAFHPSAVAQYHSAQGTCC
jgi:hypothetical protein